MPYASVNGLELYYETAGDPKDPAMLLIAGLGVQIIDWADHFVAALIEAGHFVILYDSRDIGLSTTFDGAPGDPQVVMDALLAGDDFELAYSLTDMASDAAGLLEALDFGSAHVVGVSMGGMVAQTMAIDHPARVRSLISIMSTTGAADVGQPTAEALAGITEPASSPDRDGHVAESVETAKIWGSPEHFDAAQMQALFEESWDRVGGPQAQNSGRHFCAIVASTSREEQLAKLTMPTLVVHGNKDTLITPSGGQRTANSIPGAELLMIDGMGHDLPAAFVPEIVQAMSDLVAEADAA